MNGGRISSANLPVRSADLNEVIALVDDPRTTTARLASVISKDAGLMKRLLRQANSPLYGFQRRVSDPNFAVVLLGFDALREMVVRSVVSGALRRMVNTVVHFESFWSHSVGCGLGAHLIAARTGRCDADDAFVAGLLHDIGYLVVQESVTGETTDRRGRAGQMISSLNEGHAEIGAAAAERWRLTSDIVEAIRYHHRPADAPTGRELVYAVHVAEALCHVLKIGQATYEPPTVIEPEATRILGVDESFFAVDPESGTVALFREELAHAPKFGALVHNLRDALVEAMSGLSERERLVIALLYYENVRVEACAGLLGSSVPAVLQLQNSAIEKLRSAVTTITS
jgi:putative nucleotidyltransferase with HDIG domain